MLIALLAILGVDLIVLVGIVGILLVRRRWVARQPGAFRGVIRVTEGAVDGVNPTWGRGYGRWVRDILVWTKAPFYLRNELIPSDGLETAGHSDTPEIRRLGEKPVTVRLRSGDGIVEVGAGAQDQARIIGPPAVPAPAPAPAMGTAPASPDRRVTRAG